MLNPSIFYKAAEIPLKLMGEDAMLFQRSRAGAGQAVVEQQYPCRGADIGNKIKSFDSDGSESNIAIQNRLIVVQFPLDDEGEYSTVEPKKNDRLQFAGETLVITAVTKHRASAQNVAFTLEIKG